MSGPRYDEGTLEEVARRLYEALPAMYRVPDGPPAGHGELRQFLEVLAVPLAVLRQSIQELHADLFVDTAADRMIPYLAELVGTTLVFPDPASNRRDVRGTVGWRRRKGTPPALEEMAGELMGRPVVLQEGWRRVQVVQDLNIRRDARVLPDLRPGVVAEQVTGPLDALFHAVDLRRMSATTGRRHPRHAAHWLHATTTFPLAEATAVDRTLEDSDIRFAMHPLGVRQPLRARRAADDRRPFSDRIQEQHFAADPARWFGAAGGFTVRICGLAGGVAGALQTGRVPDERVVGRQLARGDVSLTAVRLPSRGWRGPVRLEVGLVTVSGAGAGSWQPNPAGFAVRAGLDLDASGSSDSGTTESRPAAGRRITVLRLTALGGAPSRFFPGATLEVASDAPGSTASADDSQLAREGFLRGVLYVEVPPMDVHGERLLHIAADGSLYEAARPDGSLIEMPETDGELRLDSSALVSTGPGPVWPPYLSAAEPRMLNRVPSGPGRGPALMHGGLALRRTAPGPLARVAATTRCALTFAVHLEQPGGPAYRPFQRLEWDGPDAGDARWAALDADGRAVDPARLGEEYAQVAGLVRADPGRVALAVRFESSSEAALLCPAEVAWSTDDGRCVLVHLPQLDVEPVAEDPAWPTEPPFGFTSEAVRVGEDGSTWAAGSTANRRVSYGDVAPIAEAAGLRRREVRGRRLCTWDEEDWTTDPPSRLQPTAAGRLDVDVTHGLFSMAAEEPPQQWPLDASGTAPPSVTTDYEEGATMHVGARPAAREPVLDTRLARPTRLVNRSGRLHPDAPPDWHAIPRYDSLSAALAAVSARWEALRPGPADDVAEVVQFEDSATYPDEAPVWPAPPADAAAREAARLVLTIQAAERERPVVIVDPALGWTSPPGCEYESLTLRGIAFGGEEWTGATLPAAERVSLEMCTVLNAENRLRFPSVPDGSEVSVRYSQTAGLQLTGPGTIRVSDSVVDARDATAVAAPVGGAVLERVSVGGGVCVRVLDASECLFGGHVEVEDRFHGCVRYSRVGSDSTLPRLHRVVWDTPVRLVSHNRRDAAWWRLREDCSTAITRGAEDGSEMGAFSLAQNPARLAGLAQRLGEFTPVGLVTGIIRID